MIIDRANPFIPADVAALMDVNGLTELNMQRGHNDHGLEINNLDKKNFSFVGGFDGQIIDDPFEGDLSHDGDDADVTTTEDHTSSATFIEAHRAMDPAISWGSQSKCTSTRSSN